MMSVILSKGTRPAQESLADYFIGIDMPSYRNLVELHNTTESYGELFSYLN